MQASFKTNLKRYIPQSYVNDYKYIDGFYGGMPGEKCPHHKTLAHSLENIGLHAG